MVSGKERLHFLKNMEYDSKRDVYICKNQKQLKVTGIRKSKTKTGYVSQKAL